ncbi:MAG TPA: aldolase/citrate lyase family protein [Solirubrobacteraceae bacterium]|nr:aldolase/citrate lyase family protein [Solirubrobacteraceae bacterium]
MSFRDRVTARSEVLAGTFLNLGSPVAAEIIALAGFDWVAVDLEHGAGGELEALYQLQAITHTGTAGLVRIESANAARIAHALDSGADAVIVPQVRSAEHAAEVVSACRYAGSRGVARYNRVWQWGKRGGPLDDADAQVTCCIQIERSDALADADAIAATDGVDCLFVGPADLGHALGIDGGADHPDLLEAAATVADAAGRHGKAAGILTSTVAQVEHYHRLGFTFLGCSAESALLMARAQEVAAGIHALAKPA